MAVKRVTILGKRWKFSRRKVRKTDGYAHGDGPDKPLSVDEMRRREIVIGDHLSGERELDVIIHEVLHAADWHKDEHWVATVASDLARILWRLGYRSEPGPA